MRDAFGGAFMIKLLIVFIVIYVSFTAIALNYAKAFKVKNKVIQYIEDNEISDINNMTAKEKAEFNRYIDETIIEKMDYKVTRRNCPKSKYNNCANPICREGITIEECTVTDGNKIGTYYIVTSAFGWEIPFLNVLLRLKDENGDTTTGLWTISGETRTIVSETK